MAQDVFKILKDLELKAVGLDPNSNKMKEGFFTSFRTIGLPVTKDDYDNPYAPGGLNLNKPAPTKDAIDPKDADKTASSELNEKRISIAGISKSIQSYLNTFLLIDNKLEMNSTANVMPGSSKVSDTWNAIINGANGIPTVEGYTPELQKAYDDALAVLKDKDDNPSAEYEKYRSYKEIYNSKVTAFNKAYADCFTNPDKLQNWPISGVAYDNAARDAEDEWENFGYKQKIETAINTGAAKGMDPAIILINDARYRFENSLLEFSNIGKIPYTIFSPSTWYDKDNDDGWNEYTSDDYYYESYYEESDTSYSSGGGFSVGFWSLGGGFDSNSAQSHLNINTNNLQISFSYCAVDINRPWLDTTLLNLENWFLFGNYKKNCISNGKKGQSVEHAQEHVFLPSLVTSLILVKNLSISWDNWREDFRNAQSSAGADASIGWGPFAVHGNYHHHEEKRDFYVDASGESLVVSGVQIIGYVSAINPASPSVDSDKYLKTKDQ